MFINLSNHPYERWDQKQIDAAAAYGEIMDLPFPQIPADADERYVEELAEEYLEKVMKYGSPVVMVQGEFTFTYRLVNLLKDHGITALASCSNRATREWRDDEGSLMKESVFGFVRFREY